MNDNASPSLAEAETVRGLRNGDVRAWNALCEQFGHRVWAFLVKLVGDDEPTVSDLFQDTFLAASKSGRNLNAESTRLWNWLARIAHNLVAEHWRRVYRERRAVSAVLKTSSTPNANFESADDLLIRDETVETVRQVLSQMATDHAEVLVAKYVDGQSIAAIVQSLGGTTESVRSRLARARRDFKTRFERIDADSSEL